MKLYSVARSPFGARVHAVIQHKKLPVEIVPLPEGGLKGEIFLALNPMGKLPVLAFEDGTTLAESEVIADYLETVFPEPSLTPAEPLARARMKLISRIADLYIAAPLFGLFAQIAPASRDQAIVDRLFAQVGEGLGFLEAHLGKAGYAVGVAPTLADCALAPVFFWVKELARMFGRPDPLSGFEKIARYRGHLAGDPLFARIEAEMADDLAALRAGRG